MSLSKTFAGPSAEGGAAAIDVKIAVARFSTPTSTGNQDWTTTDLGGRTPKAVWLQISSATTDGTANADSILCFGASDGSAEMSATYWDDDALTTTNSKYASYNEVLHMRNAGDIVAGSFVSFITNGIRINFTTVDASNAYLCQVIFFAGDDLSASVDRAVITTVDVPVDVTGPGFEPDIVLSFWAKKTPGSIGTGGNVSCGVAVNDGSDTQKTFGLNTSVGVSTTSIRSRVASAYSLTRTTFPQPQILVSDYDASGYSVTPKSGASSIGDHIGLALNIGGLGVWAGSLNSPTSTGDWSVTAPAFTPQVVGLGLSMIQTENSDITTGDAGPFGYSIFTDSAEFCMSAASEDGVTTSNTQSLSDNTAIHMTDHAGTQTFLGSFSSMDASGWTANLTVADGTTRKWWGWAIEAP